MYKFGPTYVGIPQERYLSFKYSLSETPKYFIDDSRSVCLCSLPSPKQPQLIKVFQITTCILTDESQMSSWTPQVVTLSTQRSPVLSVETMPWLIASSLPIASSHLPRSPSTNMKDGMIPSRLLRVRIVEEGRTATPP
jgi:hypothetical protein